MQIQFVNIDIAGTYIEYFLAQVVTFLRMLHVQLIFVVALYVVVQTNDVRVPHPRVNLTLTACEVVRQRRHQVRFLDRLLY